MIIQAKKNPTQTKTKTNKTGEAILILDKGDFRINNITSIKRVIS